MRCLAGLVFVVALAVPALADDAQPSAPPATNVTPAPVPAQSDLNTVVCKKLAPTTGSHLGGQRVCQTKKRWMDLEKTSQDTLDKLQGSASQFGGGQ